MGECPIKKKGDLKTFFRKTLQEDDPKPFNKEINVSDEAKEFVFKLLTKDPAKRLGFYGEEGIKKIKSHPWFSKPEEIIWYDYLAKNVIFMFLIGLILLVQTSISTLSKRIK